MIKKPSGRAAEQRYTKRVRLIEKVKNKPTPWKQFFTEGVGATVKTSISRASVHSVVYNYGVRMGKRFSCSCVQKDDHILVKLNEVKNR